MPDNYITLTDEKGTINISEDVIAVMIAAAIAEVDGAASIAGQDFANIMGKKGVSRGVKVAFNENSIVVDVQIMVRYGNSVTGVAAKLQDAVSSAITSMTNLEAPVVNVHVGGIVFDKVDKA